MYYCTLSDKKYLLQGLALYNSLLKFEKNFILYWLCLDEETYDALTELKSRNIYPIMLSYLEHKDKELVKAKSNPACLYGTQYSQYCWALTPYFMNFVLKNFVEEGKPLMYIDSDIVFYHSPQLILNDIGSQSIGIHSHRGESKYDITNPVGEFNVGVVVIKNNEIGMQCSEWWKHCLLNPDNEYYKIYGTCGDQKYLDLFIPLFKDVCVFDRMNCGYLSPWCFDNATTDKKVIYKGKVQPVVFYHFSHFNYDLEKNTWSDSIQKEWNPARRPEIQQYYEEYFQLIKNINKSLSIPC